MTSQQAVLAILLALALVRGIIYASVVPPWQAPDEPAQFERAKAALSAREWNSTAANGPAWYDDLVESLIESDYLDFVFTRRDQDTVNPKIGDYVVLYQEVYDGLYGSRPLYAVVGAPLFFSRTWDITLQLYMVRLNTVLMSVGIVLFAYLITRTIFPRDLFLGLGVPILILFNPQHSHLLSTVNNGNLAELLSVIALYFVVRGVVKGFSWPAVVAVLVLSLAAMWTKATAYFLPFAIASIGIFYLWSYRRQWRWLLPGGLIAAGLVFFFSPERLKLLVSSGWAGLRTGSFYLDPLVPQILFRSFWAMPGWLALQLHPFWYQLLAVGCSLAGIGLILLLLTRWRLIFSKSYQPQVRALVVLAVAAVVAIAVLLSWNAITNSIIYRQGRSIYPVIVPISVFLLLGWRQLLPSNWRRFGLLALTAGLFLFDSLVLFYYVIPFFYSRY
jgi:hypothetical protein